MSRATPRAGHPTPASSATGTSSSTGCSSGPEALGFDAVATGHHARCVPTADGRFRLCRGADPLKDQSYVLAMLGQDQLARSVFPVGEMTKAAGAGGGPPPRPAHRGQARQPGRLLHPLGRGAPGFLGARLPLHPGRLVDHSTGDDLGPVDAVELVTVGQRRGMGHSPDGTRRFVTAVDVPSRRVSLGSAEAALAPEVWLHTVTWVDGDPSGPEP